MPTIAGVARTLTSLVEIAVGAGCLVGVPVAWRARSPERRWLAALLLVAGVAAVAHGMVALVS
jgi:hypothetical protein